jgi:hypothetical protein
MRDARLLLHAAHVWTAHTQLVLSICFVPFGTKSPPTTPKSLNRRPVGRQSRHVFRGSGLLLPPSGASPTMPSPAIMTKRADPFSGGFGHPRTIDIGQCPSLQVLEFTAFPCEICNTGIHNSVYAHDSNTNLSLLYISIKCFGNTTLVPCKFPMRHATQRICANFT